MSQQRERRRPERFTVAAAITIAQHQPTIGNEAGPLGAWSLQLDDTGKALPHLLSKVSAPLLQAVTGAPAAGGADSSADGSTSQGPGQQHRRAGPNPPWLHKLANQHLNKNKLQHATVPDETQGQPLCVEVTQSRKRVYRVREGQDGWQGWDMVEATIQMQGRLLNLFKSYFLPQGFPDSVAPQYASYMFWRGVQYGFGGAISVFTTKSLLGALGVAGKYAGEASAAINWVIKDGAGRLGRLLFARWGRELDCELKQFRLVGDLLMEGGAALELSTIWAPKAFLPLACTANLAKNLAAVAASATRAPIYRTFALQNNMADITAKGESVANLADIMGTIAGIVLSKYNAPLLPTFCVLSAGYLIASRKEVDSVELPTLNRARLEYVARAFLTTGTVPSIPEANHHEPVLPWNGFNNGRIELGSSVEQACQGPQDLQAALAHADSNAKHILTYRADQRHAHVLLKQGADGSDCLKAVFAAHVLLYTMEGQALSPAFASLTAGMKLKAGQATGPVQAYDAALARASQLTKALWPEFVKQAQQQGWRLKETMLNPRDTRLVHVTTPLSL